jgi:exosortase/archaeosortase family protein
VFGYGFEQQGFLLIGEGANYLITRDCLGWKSMAAFVALVFASTENIRKEAGIILTGILGLGAANILRIVSTVMLSEAGIISFDIVHTFLWRWGMTFLVLAIWYLWLNDLLKPELRGIFK